MSDQQPQEMAPQEVPTRPKLEESKRRDADRAGPKGKSSFEKEKHATFKAAKERARE